MEITDQKEVIQAVLKALENSVIGIGIKERYNIIQVNNDNTSTLVFSLKDGKKAVETDFFWLGWNANQYY